MLNVPGEEIAWIDGDDVQSIEPPKAGWLELIGGLILGIVLTICIFQGCTGMPSIKRVDHHGPKSDRAS